MKKHLLTIILAAIFITTANAQVAIKPAGSGTTADPSAMLDVQSTNKGALLPRMTAAQRLSISSGSPAIGLIVFDTDSSSLMLRTVAGWVKLQSTTDLLWKKTGNNIYNLNSGNVGIGADNPVKPFQVGMNKDVLFGADTGTNNKLVWLADKGALKIGTLGAADINSSSSIGQNSVTIGKNNSVSGENSVAIGENLHTSVSNAFVVGKLNDFGFFINSNPEKEKIFEIGNGTITSNGFVTTYISSNALTVLRNGNTGIGNINSPTQKLEIAGAIKIADTTGTPTNGTIRYTTGNGFQGMHGNSWMNLGGGNQWTTNGNDIYNSNSGNIGIGTTNPLAKQEIKSGSNVYYPQLRLTDTTENNYSRLSFTNTHTNKDWTIAALTTDNIQNDRLNFYHSTGGDIMQIRGDGKVGIGTDNPVKPFQVGMNKDVLFGVDTGSNNKLVWLADKGALKVGAASANDVSGYFTGLNSVTIGKNNKAVGDYSAAIGENLTASAQNSFVIGKYNAGSLFISNNSTPQATDKIFEIGNGTITTSGITTIFAPSNAFTVLRNGNTGIGNIYNPTQKLEVEGAIKIADTTGTPTNGTIRYTTGNGFQGMHNNTWQNLNSDSSSGNQWATNGNNIYNGNTGNVGIGTNNPYAKFEIEELLPTFRPSLKITKKGAGAVPGSSIGLEINSLRPNYSGTQETTMGAKIFGDHYGIYANAKVYSAISAVGDSIASALELDAPSGKALIVNTGNVGIGTTTPQTKLDVNGAIKIAALQGGFNPTNGMIAYDGTDFLGFNNGWKSLTTSNSVAGSGINISGNTISTIPQTLSIVGDSLALSGGGGKVALPTGGSGSSQFTTSGTDIYNNNSGKVLIGSTTATGNAKFQVEDASSFAKSAQVLSRGSYSTSLFVADSSSSGGAKGAQGALGNPSQPGNAAIHAFSKYGDAIYGNTQNGRGLYMYGGTSSYPAAQIEHNAGSTGVAIKTLGGIDVTGYLRLNDGTQQAGRVLTTDANGYASWQAPTGGGTTYTAGTGININSNVISTNLNAGTGIAISGNTISSNLVAGAGITITGNTIAATGATGAGGWQKSGASVSLETSTDYVGIGTAGNAGAKLRIAGGSDAGISVSANGSNAVFASASGSTAAGSFIGSVGANGLSVAATDANGAEFFSQNAAAISVNSSSSNSKIAIVVPYDNSGFGTTNPTAKIHINGINGLRYQDGNEGANKVLTCDANGNASWQTVSGGGSSAWTVSGNNTYATDVYGTIGMGLTTGFNTNYKLHAKNTSGSTVALFESGTGSTNISLKNSNGITAGLNALNNDLNIVTYLNGSNVGNINFTTGYSTNLSIDAASNNVGVGTSNPAQKLDVAGAIKLGTTSTNSLGTIRFNGNDFQGYDGFGWKSLTGYGLWTLDNNDAIFNNGKVGIGSTTPVEKLDVAGAIKLGYTSTNNAGTLRFNGSDFEGYNGTDWKSLTSQSLWTVNGTSIDLINGSNNVGIGASAANEKLEVAGGIKLGLASATPTTGTMQYNGGLQVHNGTDWVSLNPQFNLDGSNNLSNTTATNFGLGVASPVEKLEVTGGIKLGLASATPTAGTMQYNGGLMVHNGTDWVSLNPQFNLDGSNNLSNTTATNFGFGIATPVEKLEVNGGIKIGMSFGANEGTIRYGSNEFEGFDGTSWKSLTGKGLWAKTGTDLSLATTTDNVGIGTTTPASKLQVENSGTQLIVKETTDAAAKINFLNDGTSNFWGLTGYSNTTNTTAGFNINYSGTNLFTVNGAGDATLAGTLTQSSDMRLKRNIAPIGFVLNKIKNIGAFTYNWIDEKKDQTQQIGFLAQDLEKQFPQLVKTDANGNKSVAYSNMVPVLLQAVKDQQTQIETLEQQLKAQNIEMMKRLELLEKMLLNQNAEKAVTIKK